MGKHKDLLLDTICEMAKERDVIDLLNTFKDANEGRNMSPFEAEMFLGNVYATMAKVSKDKGMNEMCLGIAMEHMGKAIEHYKETLAEKS